MQIGSALAQVGTGDRAAFTALYNHLQPVLTRYASGLLAGDREAAADVVDEAFLDIWRSAGRYDGSGSAEGFIHRIVRNKAVDWLRSRREKPGFDEAAAAAVPDEADIASVVVEKQSAADELRRAMERLSPEHREAVWLCYFEEKSLAEIAIIAGCPENTVKTRLFHARRLLRLDLGGTGV